MSSSTAQPATAVTAKPPAPASIAPPPSQVAPQKPRSGPTIRKWLLLALVIVGCGAGYLAWRFFQPAKLPAGFASSNGRIEATEIDIATKIAGRLIKVEKEEGDFVRKGDTLAQMDTDELEAQRREAEAQLRAARTTVDTAKSTVAQRESEKVAAEATVAQREAELDLATSKFARAEKLLATTAIAREDYDTYRSALFSAKAALSTAKANVAASDAAISTAKTMIIVADAQVEASLAKIQRLRVDINDCHLKAPRDGRVQFRVSQPGEVLAAGGKVLNMVDLADVYMTFFLPTDWAGRVKMGAEARIVLDGAPQFVIPAKVTFVADVAQFTPKTVETAEERQKLTFRIKAHIPKDVLDKYVSDVKTGLPGMAYVRLDPEAKWPPHLEVALPK